MKIDFLLWVWFALTALSVAYMAYDLLTQTPAMKIMKWGWLLVALYTGPVALVVYWLSCREPSPGTHETFVAPLWKQSVGSTIHCLAGDATGIIVAASITSTFGLPTGVDSIIEYVSGFAFGLLIFQALFSKAMLGGSYGEAIKATWYAEWVSMNGVMAGMIPTMAILMSHDRKSMEPSSVHFWAVMSLASVVGAGLAYPINWWLVKNGLKHGMGTERALGKGGSKVDPKAKPMLMPAGADKQPTDQEAGRLSTPSKMAGMAASTAETVSLARTSLVAILTVGMLVAGISLAAWLGDLTVRRRQPMSMSQPMDQNQMAPTTPNE